MKKTAFLLVMLFAGLGLSAQESTTQDQSLSYNLSFAEFRSTANATSATDSVWSYTFLKESYKPLKFSITISVDSISGAVKKQNFTVYGRANLADPWVSITSASWWSGRDTTKQIVESSTARQYRYYKVEAKTATTKSFVYKVTYLFIKFWE